MVPIGDKQREVLYKIRLAAMPRSFNSGFLLAAALFLPPTALAHDIPNDVTVQAFF
jgi:hypothetical protein